MKTLHKIRNFKHCKANLKLALFNQLVKFQKTDLYNLELNRINSEKWDFTNRIKDIQIEYVNSEFKIIGRLKQ